MLFQLIVTGAGR